MAERTPEEIEELYVLILHTVDDLNTLYNQEEISEQDITKIKEKVETVETIKAYKKEDGTTSIWTAEDFTAQDAAVTLGKTKY
jgi:hypothetical protein